MWFATALLIVMVLLWRSGLSGLLWRAMGPLMAARESLSSSQVTDLEAELASSTAALADRDLLYQENLNLKQILGRSGGKQIILAGVLMRPPATPYDTLMLDAGSEQGVAVGDLVLGGGESAIGTIAQVYPTTARAELFSSPGQNLTALLTSGDGAATPIDIVGQGSGSMTATVPAGTGALVGETIVFPGVNGNLAAKVSAVTAKEGDSFETIYLKLPTNPFALRFVEILK